MNQARTAEGGQFGLNEGLQPSQACFETMHAALEECQRALAMMVDPASINKTTVMFAWAAAVSAEAKARKALSGATLSPSSHLLEKERALLPTGEAK